jgi:lipid II:glycine glycyltransferase (peptidoglycan interpeptide bridge formation enzyme)
MVKKRVKKKSSTKNKKTQKISHKTQSDTIEGKLVDNLVELQKVHTNLAEKFDNLSSQLSTLLKLFETAARSFAEHPSVKASEKDSEFLSKIDKLLEQNKTIAKGLTLMEERVRERMYGVSPPLGNSGRPVTDNSSKEINPEYKQSIGSRPLPRF